MSEKLKLAEKTALDIDRLRDGYRPAARRGAVLFFVLSEMALVNAMYQYSLSAFLDVFGLSLKKSLPDSILIKRLRNIMDTLTFNIYNYGCTGERPGRARSGCASGVRVRTSGGVGPAGGLPSAPLLFRGSASGGGRVRALGSGLPHRGWEAAEPGSLQGGGQLVADLSLWGALRPRPS